MSYDVCGVGIIVDLVIDHDELFEIPDQGGRNDGIRKSSEIELFAAGRCGCTRRTTFRRCP